MRNFKKAYKLRIISILVAVLFLINNSAYGIDLSEKQYLRTPLITSQDERIERLSEFIDTLMLAKQKF